MFHPLKVTFHLDGTGVLYDPAEPTHLDSLLTFAAVAHHACGEAPSRTNRAPIIPLPLERWHVGETWGWCASALFPDGQVIESLQFWRKKFRTNRIQLATGSPNLTNATYREYNMPMPLVLCHSMVAWCVGDRRKIRHELIRSIRHLGRKASMGKGTVNDVTVEHTDEDWSLLRDGRAQRWLPMEDGVRLVRPRPPYWNNTERVASCEVGEGYDASRIAIGKLEVVR
jgi:CRISPR type IV-associated protein Csf3